MAVDKLVDSTQLDADLTSVANAIRTKGGTSASLAFPADFVSAIAAIPSGGADNYAEYINGNLLTYSSDDVTTIAQGRIQSGWLTSISFPNCTSVATNGCFGGGLTSFYLPKVSSVAGGGFRGNKLKYIVLPSLESLGTGEIFSRQGGAALLAADFGAAGLNPPTIGTSCFYDNSKMDTLVLRYTSLVTLGATGGLPGRFQSNGAGGTLYVPQSLISSYQGATNWSTILGYTNNQIKSIESTHTDPTAPIDLTLYYADGTLIPT